MEKILFKKIHPDAILPSRGSSESCGLDVCSVEDTVIQPAARKAVRTGFAVAVPSGFYGRLAPRSGLALKFGIDVLAGVIDADYRGEVLCLLVNLGEDAFQISAGDRIAQLIIEKVAIGEPLWTEELPATDRGAMGFGSTGI
jgi:deoxyuridine 5'-triphosphate nucleotidohydrolase